MLVRALVIKGASFGPVKNWVRNGRYAKPLVSRFVAGDTLDEALAAAKACLASGMRVSLDYLGENTRAAAEAEQAKATYSRMLDAIASLSDHRAYDPEGYARGEVEPLNISIKLTQCGLDQGIDLATGHFNEVVSTAREQGNFVRVDMESHEYVDRTLDLVQGAHKQFGNTGTVLQSYLHRTPADLDRLLEAGVRVRIVKGAYLEPPEVAYAKKSEVDRAYVALAKKLLTEGVYPAIATQDPAIIDELNRFIDEKKLDKSRFEYQMLYGIRRDLQNDLHQAGYRVRVYIPFGDAWYPYFTRRLAERPANMLFIAKNLFKG